MGKTYKTINNCEADKITFKFNVLVAEGTPAIYKSYAVVQFILTGEDGSKIDNYAKKVKLCDDYSTLLTHAKKLTLMAKAASITSIKNLVKAELLETAGIEE